MFKDRFIANLLGMATWYGAITMLLELLKFNLAPLVIIAVAAFMAWARK